MFDVLKNTPKVLINTENAKSEGINFNHEKLPERLFLEGDCNKIIKQLAEDCDKGTELQNRLKAHALTAKTVCIATAAHGILALSADNPELTKDDAPHEYHANEFWEKPLYEDSNIDDLMKDFIE